MFNKLIRSPAYKTITEALQQAIEERLLKLGDALPTEAALAEQFGVNRSTVREGIRHLEAAGFVQRQGKRLVVTRPSHDELGDQVSRGLMLHDVSFQDLWEVTMALEPLAAELAARHISEDQKSRLLENLEATRRATDGGGDLVQLDVEFHALVAQATENRPLLVARQPLSLLFYPAFANSMFPEKATQRLLAAHTMICDAIVAGDQGTAREWMRKHIVDFKRGYEMAGLNIDDPVKLVRPPASDD